jgi:DNA-binding transcriptional ArsR family regulator
MKGQGYRPADQAQDPVADKQRTIDQNLVKAIAHPTRVRILEALHGRTASPVEMAEEWDMSLGVITYHVNTLADVGCIEQVDARPRRGAIEHVYTAKPRSFIGHQDWRRAPLSVRAGVTSEALRTFAAKIGEAIDADTIDKREDSTLNWMPVTVDEQGWREVARILDRAGKALTKVAAASRERLGSADGIPVVTGLAAFETPPVSASSPDEDGEGS